MLFTELKCRNKFHPGQVFSLLSCYAVYVGSCLLMFRESFSVPSLRIKQSCPLKIGLRGCPETSVNNYQHTLCSS